jgi:large subunit ribosomal protein L4
VTLPVLNDEGITHGRAALAPRLVEQTIKPHLIHETVVAELAWRRSGSASTRTRGERRGGGAKPWRQKGTGRARAGSTRSPLWTGGGVTFGPSPRSYGGKVNRKVRRQAFLSALRAHAERGSAAIMDPTGWDEPSTKRAAEYLRQAPDELDPRPLAVVLADPDSPDGRSFRNIAGIAVFPAEDVETVDLMSVRGLLVQRSVWEQWTGAPCEVEEVASKRKPKPTKAKKQPPKKAPEPEPEAPADEEPAADEPVADEPLTEPLAVPTEPVEEPAEVVAEPEAAPAPEPEPAPADEPAAKKPAAKKPAPKKPAAKKPAPKKPAAKKAAPKKKADEDDKPAAKKPAAKKPAAKKSEDDA